MNALMEGWCDCTRAQIEPYCRSQRSGRINRHSKTGIRTTIPYRQNHPYNPPSPPLPVTVRHFSAACLPATGSVAACLPAIPGAIAVRSAAPPTCKWQRPGLRPHANGKGRVCSTTNMQMATVGYEAPPTCKWQRPGLQHHKHANGKGRV